MISRAAFHAAIEHCPRTRLTLRQGVHRPSRITTRIYLGLEVSLNHVRRAAANAVNLLPLSVA